MNKTNFYTRFKEDGSLYTLGFIAIGMLVGALLGGLYGGLNVLFFEQTESGRYAVYEDCTDVVSYQTDRGTASDCVRKETAVRPLGQRIKDQAISYALLFGGIAFGPGAIIGNTRWNKRKKKEEKPDDWVDKFIESY